MTFRYSATLGGFDDTPLVDFARDKELITCREHFYLVNDVPHLTCIVVYQDAIVPQAALDAAREISPRPATPAYASGGSGGGFRRRDGAPDPCEGLTEPERALFNHLREWRSRTAHAEGVPPYLVLTNRQLVAIVRKRPDSATALGHIDGVGPAKVERYGAAILACLHGSGAPPASKAPAPASERAVSVAEPPASAPGSAASVAVTDGECHSASTPSAPAATAVEFATVAAAGIEGSTAGPIPSPSMLPTANGTPTSVSEVGG